MILFSALYGFTAVNYADSVVWCSRGLSDWGHVWLISLYFAPFIPMIILRPRLWMLAMASALITSLANDGLWGFWNLAIGAYDWESFVDWLQGWFIPSERELFTLKLGVTKLPVTSLIMATSIYSRITLITLLLLRHRR
ncbi:MAG: hypothetical protein QXP81_11210 [Nitrososphaerota archaeon]